METEVHNCYTLYELDEDGSKAERPLLCFNRPQDWGDPERWNYHYCKIELESNGEKYINHCHIWQEAKRHTIPACQTIAPSLFMIMMPGQPRELCDRSHLDHDDFWWNEWGKRPPYFENEDYYGGFEDDTEPELIPPGGSLYCWRVWHPNQDKAIQEAQLEPFPEAPFPSAALLYTLKADGKGGHNMKDSGETEQPTTGFLFGTHLSEEQQLSQSWSEKGWQIERQPSMERIG